MKECTGKQVSLDLNMATVGAYLSLYLSSFSKWHFSLKFESRSKFHEFSALKTKMTIEVRPTCTMSGSATLCLDRLILLEKSWSFCILNVNKTICFFVFPLLVLSIKPIFV